ncbi:glycine zipper 2TM domain-containing protein [Massilia sp. SR12]
MNTKTKLIFAALSLGALPLAHATDFEDYGRVTRVTPVTEQINRPRQECRTEYVQVQQPAERSAGGAILGGVLGAVVGSQVGSGSGKTAATAAGAIAGAVIGDRSANANVQPGAVQEQAVKQCRMVDAYETRTTGYNVEYDYRGRIYSNVMSFDPGQRVRLRVSVEPMHN